jgi:hypothetical protein
MLVVVCGLSAGCSEKDCDSVTDCVESLAEIELTRPAQGTPYDAEQTDICWRDTAPEGSQYEVDYVYNRCPDEEALAERPHPYGELLPDPADRERLRDLRRQQRHLQEVVDYWDELCESQAGEAVRVEGAQQDLDTVLDQLDTLNASDELSVVPPANCDVQDDCCNDAPCCEGLDLTTTEGREQYAARLRCLENKVRRFEGIRIAAQAEFNRLLVRWRSGESHRATMAFYDAYFQLIDETIEVFNELVDIVTGGILQSAIEEHLTAEVCELYPDECDEIQTAGDVADTLDTLQSLISSARAGNGMPPMFILQMVQAMAQTAQNATSVGVEGWENFAMTMNGQFQQAYKAALCQKKFLALQAATAEACADECATAEQGARDDLDNVAGEITQLTEVAAEDRNGFWQQQQDELKAALQTAAASLSDEQLLECCDEASGSSSYAIPGDSGPCVDMLADWLYGAVGERACYHDWTVEITCDATGLGIGTSYSFPNQNRREDCCDPNARVEARERIGEPGEATGGGQERCLPAAGDAEPAATRRRIAGQMRGRSAGRVQVRSRNGLGMLDGISPLQPIAPHPGSFVPPPNRKIPIQCQCSCDVMLDGAPVPDGSVRERTVGDILDVASLGDCGPACGGGVTDISVQPPPLKSAANPQGLQLPLQVFSQPAVQFGLDHVGTYSLVVQRTCEDGARCFVELEINVTPEAISQPKDPIDLINATPAACGDMPCLTLGYMAPNDISDEFAFNYAAVSAADVPLGSVVMLQLTSDCYRECLEPATVSWVITSADDNVSFYSGPDLYMLELPLLDNFYTICVTEVGGCLEESYSAQRYFVLERL